VPRRAPSRAPAGCRGLSVCAGCCPGRWFCPGGGRRSVVAFDRRRAHRNLHLGQRRSAARAPTAPEVTPAVDSSWPWANVEVHRRDSPMQIIDALAGVELDAAIAKLAPSYAGNGRDAPTSTQCAPADTTGIR
jgi:hypothetical protein